MPLRYRVEQGDSVVKLAKEHGLSPDTIWNHPDNADLKERRKDMNILAAGDEVVIPDREPRRASAAAGKTHVFKRRGVPMIFRLQLLEYNQPRKDRPYVLEVDGVSYEGTTDDQGRIERYLPNDARRGRLRVGDGEVDVEILFGHMDPISEVSGVQRRLINLGFDCGEPGGELTPRTLAALRAFQALVGLEPNGELSDETRDTLASCHDQPGKLQELASQKQGG